MRFITILSDFGTTDASAAIAKSILKSHNPDTEILEISHTCNSNNLIEPAYLLASSYREFPVGTCHIAYLSVYHSNTPSLVLCEQNGHYFLAPNNGLLPLALGKDNLNLWQCYEWGSKEHTFRDWQSKCAEIVRDLGHSKPEELGFPGFELDPIRQISMPLPVINEQSVDCQILHVSYKGNVVLNIQQDSFERLRNNRKFRIELVGTGDIHTISHHYGEVAPGEVMARFNRAGYLEIAIHNESASSLLGIKPYREKQLFYSTVKIFFE